MDSLETSAVQIAGGVAGNQEAVPIHARHRVVAAFRNGLRSGGDHLSSFENLPDRRMELVPLELVMRVEGRIAVVETDDEADIDDAIFHPVDETASESLELQRPPEGMNDGAGGEAIRWKLPELLDADRIDLGVLAGVQIKL